MKEEDKEEQEKAQEAPVKKMAPEDVPALQEFKDTLKQVEMFGLSDKDRQSLAQDTGFWPQQVQLLVSAYIKNLRFKNAVMHKTHELIASGMVKPEDAATYSQAALEQVSVRSWQNIPQEGEE